jgi:uncharacterized membrane protein YdbT with pleckstrin-like domain
MNTHTITFTAWRLVSATLISMMVAVPLMLLGGFWWLLGFVYLLAAVVDRAFTQYTFTDEWVRFQSGVIQRREHLVPVEDIDRVTLNQSIWGRMIGVGTVIVNTRGGSRLRFRDVDRPADIVWLIQDSVDRYTKSVKIVTQ